MIGHTSPRWGRRTQGDHCDAGLGRRGLADVTVQSRPAQFALLPDERRNVGIQIDGQDWPSV